MVTKLTRRTLLASTAVAGAGLLLPGTASAASRGVVSTAPFWDRIVILIELDGGNDGLNTVVPFNVSDYIDRRPTLKYAASELAATMIGTGPYVTHKAGVSATQNFALNPAMTHLMKAWNPATPDTHDLAVVLGVGYANPNLSHFRSMDIWNGASYPTQFPIDCWLGRLFAQPAVATTTPASLTAHGVLLSRYSSNPLKKDGVRFLAMSKPKDFIDRSYELRDTPGSASSPHFQYFLKTQHEVYQAAGKFRDALLTPKVASPDPTKSGDWNYTPPTFAASPDITFNVKSDFEMRCKSIAEMISTNANINRLQVPVYKVQIGGFDNHSGQKVKQEDLLAQVSSAMTSLRGALKQIPGLWERTLIMTYSEFGRRVEENGSQGTDHGTANCHFLMGGGVKGGIYGQQPGLYNGSPGTKDLDGIGNLVYTVDFRRLYSTVAQWLGLPIDSYLTAGTGEDFSPIPCLW